MWRLLVLFTNPYILVKAGSTATGSFDLPQLLEATPGEEGRPHQHFWSVLQTEVPLKSQLCQTESLLFLAQCLK